MPEVKPIVKEPNKILRSEAKAVLHKDMNSSKIRSLILSMKETLKNTPDGVGLAAPQVGESLKIFIVSEEAEEIDRATKNKPPQPSSKCGGKDEVAEAKKRYEKKEGEEKTKPYDLRAWKYYVFINPEVKNISRKKVSGPEGCLSVPGKFGIVKRHQKITVEAYDEHGKKFTRGASNFFARVIQHELDHLKGMLFIDRADEMLD